MSFSSLYTQRYILNKYRTCSNYIRGKVGIRCSRTRYKFVLKRYWITCLDTFQTVVSMSSNTNVSSCYFQLGFDSELMTRVKLKNLARKFSSQSHYHMTQSKLLKNSDSELWNRSRTIWRNEMSYFHIMPSFLCWFSIMLYYLCILYICGKFYASSLSLHVHLRKRSRKI